VQCERECRCPKSVAELSREVILQLIPRNELSQLDLAIVTRKLAAKEQKEVFEQELMTMLTPIHVENSVPLLCSDWSIGAHFNAKKC